MTLPTRARIEAAPNFLANLDSALDFFRLQDAGSAQARQAKLKSELRDMFAILSWSPASGRPARFLAARSAQISIKADMVLQLANQSGLPNLREFIVGQHIVLYAHSDTSVVLLALRHQRQLVYSAAPTDD